LTVHDKPHGTSGRAVLILPGLGSEWVGMGADLLASEPAFSDAAGQCANALAQFCDAPVLQLLRGMGDESMTDLPSLNHPALFTMTVGLAELWRARAVVPDAIVGHSVGEVAAGYLSGALSLSEAARITASRSIAWDTLRGQGAIVSVALPRDDLARRLLPWQGELVVAAVNSPRFCTVSGDLAAAVEFIGDCRREGIWVKQVAGSLIPVHSHHLDALREGLLVDLAGLSPSDGSVPFYSTVTGDLMDGAELDAEYWFRNMREPVSFDKTIRSLLRDGYRTFIEASPHPQLTVSVQQIADDAGVDVVVHGTLRREERGRTQAAPIQPERQASAALDLIRANLAKILGDVTAGEIDVRRPFADLGLDSLRATTLAEKLSQAVGFRLPASLVFDHPTPASLARYLDHERVGSQTVTSDRTASGEAIAIVSMSCRYPGGVRSPEDLWKLALAGTDAISRPPGNRGWALDAPDSPRYGGFLHDADEFDAGFFGISPREALAMEPQQRLLLEGAWEAFEQAGLDPATLPDRRVGVFVGAIPQEYGPRYQDAQADLEGYLFTGGTGSVASGRIAYAFDLEGPAVTVDTACSSSLVAIHLASQALRTGECSMALAGGATVIADPRIFVEFGRQRLLSPDGRCKSFAAAADGTCWAEGVGLLLLERLSDAERNGHQVLAVIRGSATNSDGTSNGLAAPNGTAQQRVIRQALANAGLTGRDVDAVEAHGTGTKLGDPIEATALLATYGQDRETPLLLGSLKSNIGHSQAAAGVAGIIKMVSAMRHGVLPATLHVDEPSPHVDWTSGQVGLLTENTPWPDSGRPRRAGVSSFGISGTNAHVILEQGPSSAEETPSKLSVVPMVVSAKSEPALRAQAARLRTHLETHQDLNPAEAGFSLATGRVHFPHRAAVVAGDREALLEGLEAASRGEPGPGLVTGHVAGRVKTVFVFSGHGSQWPAMAAELFDSAPAFRRAVQDCAAAFAPHLDWSVLDVLRGVDGAAPIERADVLQPSLFVMQVSLARLWQAHGVTAHAVVGHSVGEIAAAHIAGILSLTDAARIIAVRGKACVSLAGSGATVSVALSEHAAAELLWRWDGRLSIAAVNSADSCAVSGDVGACAELLAVCEADGIWAAPVPGMAFAAHSSHLDSVRERFLSDIAAVRPRSGDVEFYSTVTGSPVDGLELNGEYWYRNLREPVRYDSAVRRLVDDGHTVFIETSAHPVLAVPTRQTVGSAATVIGTLRRGDGTWRRFLTSLAEAHVHGTTPDWDVVFSGTRASFPGLPGYPFQPRRYWLDGGTGKSSGTSRESTQDSWRYRVDWRQAADSAQGDVAGTWLVLVTAGHDDQVAPAVQALAEGGAELRRLVVGDGEDRRTLAARLGSAWRPGDPPLRGVLALPGFDLAGTLVLTQALIDADLGAPFWLLTRGAVGVGDDDPVVSASSARLWGFGRCVALEHPDLWGGLIDLPQVDDERLGTLLRRALGTGHEDQVALRPAGSFVPRLMPAVDPPEGDWHPRGTVLITGGTGALGAHVARWLAAAGAEHVVLLSRRGPRAPGVPELVAEIEGLGSSATVIACDVSDRAALAAAIDGIQGGGAPIRAVVHAAGTHHRTPIAQCSASQLAEIDAKAVAAAHLDELFEGQPLDAFVLFSSAAGVLGGSGQSMYAAANAFLDALAGQRQSRGLAATAVAWGPWAGPGMGAEGDTGEYLRRRGMVPMNPRAAVAELRRALGHGRSCLVVADVDWTRFVPAFTAARARPILDELPQARRVLGVPETRQADGNLVAAFRQRLAALSGHDRTKHTADLVRTHVAVVLGLLEPAVTQDDRPFRELGFDSLTSVELRDRLSTVTGLRLPVTTVFDHPTISALTDHLLTRILDEEPSAGRVSQFPAGPPAPSPADPIAIIGMGCRYPGDIRNPADLWRLVTNGTDAIGPFPADRGWDTDLYDPDPGRAGKSYTRAGGFLYDAGRFDAAFFGISPREALAMDPQQRLLLETAWETVEHAGIDPSTLRGTPTGVFTGTTTFAGTWPQTSESSEGYLVTGTSSSVLSGRIAYTLGLRGPAVTTDTACSASLVAVHLASQSLRTGESSLALAGGVSIMATPQGFVEFSRQRGLAPDGRCKPFAAAADGITWSEGVGLLLLERLSDAKRNGHRILGVLRGSALNHDGASNGLAAPNGSAQQEVIRQALLNAGLGTADIDAVEAHGTGTKLGDPIEANALLATYGQTRGVPLLLGSIKSNIGHTQAAAGVAGIIKTVQAIRHGMLPPTLHVDEPTPHADWDSGSIRLLSENTPWPDTGRPRRAGISAFGISGTNAHVIVEQAPHSDLPVTGGPSRTGPLPVILTAKTEPALREQARRLREHVADDPDIGLGDLAFSLATARTRFPQQHVVATVDSRETLLDVLAAVAAGRSSTAADYETPPDWADAAGVTGATRIELPTYPFQRGHYWLETPKPGQNAIASGMAVTGHPFLGADTELPDGGHLFTGRLSVRDQPWLADHVVAARITVPGTAFVELARYAARRTGHHRISELILETALALTDDGAVRLQLVTGPPNESDGRVPILIRSRADGVDTEWIRHAGGMLEKGVVDPPARTADWPPPGAEPIDVDEVYKGLDGAGYRYGPALRGLRAAWRLGDDLYTESGLPQAGEAGFGLHPALLDSAFHALSTGELLLPFSWSGITQWSTGAVGGLRTHIAPTGPRTFAVEVADQDGVPLLGIESLVLRPAARRGSLFELVWTAAPSRTEEAPETVSPASHGDDVVFPCSSATSDDPVAAAHSLNRLVLARLQQWLAEDRPGAARLVFLTTGAVAASGAESVRDLAAAAVWGLVRAAQAEHPGRFVLVDVDGLGSSPRNLAAALALGWPELVIRDGIAHRSRLRPLTPREDSSQGKIDPDGTVLITGGTGALGGLVARHLVTRHGAGHLLLVSRSGPLAPGAAALEQELRGLGAEVTVLACDVSDPEALREMLASVPATHPLIAVVHTAAVIDDATIGSSTSERLDSVLGPKLDAAWHLHHLTKDLGLSAFVLFSSLSGTIGNPGQGAYGAANAFLDALASHRLAEGKPAISLAWGLWAARSSLTGGLAEASLSRIARRGVTALSSPDGLALFDAVWGKAQGPPALVAADLDLSVAGQVGDIRPAPLPTEGTEDARRQRLLDVICSRAALVLGYSVEKIDPERGFLELGFDSLTSVELRDHLGKLTGMRLSTTVVFDHPTPAALADHLAAGLGLGKTGPSPVPATTRQGEDRRNEISTADIGELVEMALSGHDSATTAEEKS
jgi:polyketide synthase 12